MKLAANERQNIFNKICSRWKTRSIVGAKNVPKILNDLRSLFNEKLWPCGLESFFLNRMVGRVSSAVVSGVSRVTRWLNYFKIFGHLQL